MKNVGLAITVPNANYNNVKKNAHWITPRLGGYGAVRDVCDLIYLAKKVMNLNNILLSKSIKKNIVLMVSIVFIFLAWANYILSNALNYNPVDNHDEKISNHFLNRFSYGANRFLRGQISWVLKGEKLEKFSNNERSEIIEPRMKILSTEN